MTYLTPADLGRLLQVSSQQVRRFAHTGEWPSSKVGTRFRFSQDDVEAIRELIRTPKAEQVKSGSVEELLKRIA